MQTRQLDLMHTLMVPGQLSNIMGNTLRLMPHFQPFNTGKAVLSCASWNRIVASVNAGLLARELNNFIEIGHI